MVGELFFPPNLHLLTLLEKQVDVGLAAELFFSAKGRINNSPANFTSTCFYSDFHAKQVDVKLAGKIILKASLNTLNNHQTYHRCHRQCC
jgi:hypothetical protein